MNIIDIVIVLLLAMGAVVGFKRGFTKSLVSFVGFILVVALSFLLKTPVSSFFYEHLPFFKFGGMLKGITVLNIAFYEILAFFLVFGILMALFKILLMATSIFETVLKFTIVLGIPSKILGAIVGVAENFVFAFIILYILSLPFFNVDIVRESKLRKPILESTPILSKAIDNTVQVFDEFVALKDKYEQSTSPMDFNRETLDLFLKYKIIDVESVEKLVQKNKLEIDGINELLNKYKEA